MSKLNTVLALASISLIAPSIAHAANCHLPGDASTSLWFPDKIYGEDVSSNWPTNGDSPTFGQERYYYQQITKTTVKEACQAFAKYYDRASPDWNNGERDLILIESTSRSDIWRCSFDCNSNGKKDDDTSECSTLIEKRTKTDPVCDRTSTISGPYDDGSSGYVRGTSFTDAQKSTIRYSNHGAFGYLDPVTGAIRYVYHSDAYGIPDDQGVFDLEPQILSDIPNREDSAEIDHLVPRVDKYGCGCGTNSPANAAIISRALNSALSNDPDLPARTALLDAFTPASFAASNAGGEPTPPASATEVAIANVDDARELGGGCSAAGGAGGSGLGGALLGLATLAGRRKYRQR